MVSVKWKKVVGQDRIKEVLSSAAESESLGHAYLFCGETGTGTFAAALEFSMALLCENKEDCPCYQCDSCKKVLKYSHQDLHVIMPVALQKEHSSSGKLNENGWKYLSECVTSRINDPYKPQQFGSPPSIPVEWMREITHAIGRGSLGKGLNIAIMDGADMLKKESANTMLKTLEEPPNNTLIILIAEKNYTVLPTIISRCQLLRFAALSPEILRSELAQRLSIEVSDPTLNSLIHTGSLGQSLELANNPPGEIIEKVSLFWKNCIERNWFEVVSDIDELTQSGDAAYFERFFHYLLQLLRFSFLDKYIDTENYFKTDSSNRIELPSSVSPSEVERVVALCQDVLMGLRVRGNCSMILSDFACSLMEIFDGKE
ncbi:DNA polymerase III subunit [Chitinispirillales bacterium ANBcel5]|uniref:DNA polymerase III subunit n=1 Tax=Cellulosispirillum alkaliphilum TaxID=3039283 RepID=UPI002A591D67|nr:DNA polymerase III subunit [Chitinispirillales bacterium ANBcel5]